MSEPSYLSKWERGKNFCENNVTQYLSEPYYFTKWKH